MNRKTTHALTTIALCVATGVTFAQNTNPEKPKDGVTGSSNTNRESPQTPSGATGSNTSQRDRTDAAKRNASGDDRQAWERIHRVSKIIGTDVHNARGEKIGDVEDIVLDRKGNVAYAIISTGGFIGIGDKLHAVPWNALDTQQGRSDGFVVDMDKARLIQAPSFDSGSWPDFNDERWMNENRRAYPQRQSQNAPR